MSGQKSCSLRKKHTHQLQPCESARTDPIVEDEAEKWFGILPKDGQMENTFAWDKRTGRMTLNGKIIEK